jgi:hypothetical protein
MLTGMKLLAQVMIGSPLALVAFGGRRLSVAWTSGLLASSTSAMLE